MAVRKKVRTVTMLETDGRTSPVTVTTTWLNSLKSLKVTFAGERANMFFSEYGTEYVAEGKIVSLHDPRTNRRATDLAYQGDTQAGRTRPFESITYRLTGPFSGNDTETIVRDAVLGAAYLEPLLNPSRYARVVSIKPVAAYYTPNVIADTRNAFHEWAADQFPAEYRPVFLYDHRGCFVACEHPDETVRNAWLVASRLRWG